MGEMNGCVCERAEGEISARATTATVTHDIDHVVLDVCGRPARQKEAANRQQSERQQRNLLLAGTIGFPFDAFQHAFCSKRKPEHKVDSFCLSHPSVSHSLSLFLKVSSKATANGRSKGSKWFAGTWLVFFF
jgi:hypothetical protein